MGTSLVPMRLCKDEEMACLDHHFHALDYLSTPRATTSATRSSSLPASTAKTTASSTA